jgi:hypothetical protein
MYFETEEVHPKALGQFPHSRLTTSMGNIAYVNKMAFVIPKDYN